MAIVGNSGSGKSTLLNMLGGLDRPSAGKLFVDGKNLFKLDETELVAYKKMTVGFVWQNNARNLVPYLTAWQNVQMPMLFDEKNEGAVGAAVNKKLRALELLELVGIDHKKNARLQMLSGGEQQRVAIAIALANNPKILLADEPTGSVDMKTASYLLDMFERLNEELGLTIVIVTHDRSLAHKVRRVVAIRDGKTSSEILMKQSYALDDAKDKQEAGKEAGKEFGSKIDQMGYMFGQGDQTHEEYAVLDRAGRVQIPAEFLAQMQMSGHKIKMEMSDGKVVLSAPENY
jgi:ABC-type lipoprotein export system ATPase subunit